MIDKPILELLTFGSNPDFSGFGSKLTHFCDFLTLEGFGKVLEKLNFQAVIKSAASAASLITA